MLAAIAYAVGGYVGVPLITLPQMVDVHGWANSLGFALCGVLGWTMLRPPTPLAPPGTPCSGRASRGQDRSDWATRHRVGPAPRRYRG